MKNWFTDMRSQFRTWRRKSRYHWTARNARARARLEKWMEHLLAGSPFMLVSTTAAIRKNYERQIDILKDDNAAERQRLADIIGRSMMVSGFRDKGRTYRLVLEFSDEFILRGLSPGDTAMVEYLSHRMGRELERQLRTINFAALPDEDEYLQRRQSWRN